MRLTDLQKRIGAVLLKGPKTAEEIAEELDEDIQDVMEALKELIVMRLVIKEGSPPRYALAPHIREAVRGELEGGIAIHAIIEVEGVEEEAVRKALEEIREKLEGEKGFIVKRVALADIGRDEEMNVYYGHLEATLIFPGLEPLVYFLFFYGPSVVELLTTEKIEVEPGDLQRALVLAANMIHGYATYISRLLGQKEIEEFNRELLRRMKG